MTGRKTGRPASMCYALICACHTRLILAKMLQIAAALKGKVQGDDGEVYRSANFSDHYDED